jgi:type II restriction/modification system DNA methylase subunit YeeA
MKSNEIQHNVQSIIDDFSKKEFIYDLLIAYGILKQSVTRLKKGDYNVSKIEGEILYKKKIFFKVEQSDKLLSSLEEVAKENRVLKQKPRFAILTDYKHIVAKDLKLGTNLDIELKELPNYFDFFLPLAGSEVYNAKNDNEADRNASYKMASLYDLLIEENPEIYNSKEDIHKLNIFLSRMLFCFFAEDTEIFEENIFTNTLAQHTTENGKDTNTFLDNLFDRLNAQKGDKYPDYLAKFPYVNGGLFSDKINAPIFTKKARKTLIDLGELQWKDINPDIFGSMIQAVVDKDYRSDLGMHYTSVENILKLIKPLFLDELYEEFEKATTVNQLRTVIKRISKIKFFDPACGSGNFLIITYKEVRLLEIKILEKIIELSPNPTLEFTQIQLSQFYGIEIDDFAHEMAILSLWLAEHQMNKIFEDTLFDFGKSKPILPLKEAGQITQGNATRVVWESVCPITEKDEVYIIGNPPYLGSRNQDKNQKADLDISINMIKSYRKLDYISIWFYKSTKYIQGYNAKSAFVSTNSICQGEQVGIFWPSIFEMNIEFDFAYTNFKWTNNAKGNAGVTVVIIGLRNLSKKPKYLITNGIITKTQNISPNLENGLTKNIKKQTKPLSSFPKMRRGNMPNDKQFLRISKEEKEQLLIKYPLIQQIIKKQVGADEFINNLERYCYWISDENLSFALTIPEVKLAVDNCYDYRTNSKDKTLHTQALRSHQFREFFECNNDSLLIPIVSSENREYIPIGFVDSNTIIPNSAQVIYDANSLIFGILTSKMHNLWVKFTAGRLENRFRYSIFLCYNTFPFPNITTKQKENLNLYVFAILDERAKHPSKTMAQLYNPDTMPKGLLQAHQELDTAIEQCYRLQPFKNDTERLEYLFKQYEEMVKKDTLFAKQKKTRKRKAKI